MRTLNWYWYRLLAMSPGEVALHARKRARQLADTLRTPDGGGASLEPPNDFPKLPKPGEAPRTLRDALKWELENILNGRWKAFGHLDLQVDDPPKWHKDYLAGKDLATTRSAFRLDHRSLPDGADIKLIWELSRWYPLARLAMAAYVLGEDRAARKCVEWLEDWVQHNQPYRGWNWTSALEAGLRLVQFTWIDALLAAAFESGVGGQSRDLSERLGHLRNEILPSHVWYVWRHRSFGSSANNHLIGELAGLIVAEVRWPALEKRGASLDELQRRWEREVLAQFADDGGNREQALNYHLFSWEFCWQVRTALLSAGRVVDPKVNARLYAAARFFTQVQVEEEIWDYGDSDNAFVTPVFLNWKKVAWEWRAWLDQPAPESAVAYWWGAPPTDKRVTERTDYEKGGTVHKSSQIAVDRWNLWTLRFDLSEQGYLKTAAHGHLDALHVSIWYRGVAMVIDPGTGAYYADARLRSYLASSEAHNGPCPVGLDFPRRLGPFLWSQQHPKPKVNYHPGEIEGELQLPTGLIRRKLVRVQEDACWRFEDSLVTDKAAKDCNFVVRWQFAPGAWVKRIEDRRYRVCRNDVSIDIEIGREWGRAELVEPLAEGGLMLPDSLEGVVSPAFRKIERAPFLKLFARPERGKACVFRTTFLASPRA